MTTFIDRRIRQAESASLLCGPEPVLFEEALR